MVPASLEVLKRVGLSPNQKTPQKVVTQSVLDRVGNKILLDCVGSDVRHPVSWLLNSQLLQPKKITRKTRGRIVFNAEGSVVFRRVRADDAGLYSCY